MGKIIVAYATQFQENVRKVANSFGTILKMSIKFILYVKHLEKSI